MIGIGRVVQLIFKNHLKVIKYKELKSDMEFILEFINDIYFLFIAMESTTKL